MCCNLRTHVIVISILSLILTILTILTGLSIGPYYGFFWGLAIVVLLDLLSGTLCLIGALKNNKCLLIPFFIIEGLQIMACIGLTIPFVFLANQHTRKKHTRKGNEEIYYLFIIPLSIALGLRIYFLTIAIKFYQELSSGVVGGRVEGFVLQSYTSPLQAEGGVSTVYVPPNAVYVPPLCPPNPQNVMYAYQQQPPSYAQTQQEKAQQIDLEIKHPV